MYGPTYRMQVQVQHRPPQVLITIIIALLRKQVPLGRRRHSQCRTFQANNVYKDANQVDFKYEPVEGWITDMSTCNFNGLAFILRRGLD